MRISDWSSDVCSSDLHDDHFAIARRCAVRRLSRGERRARLARGRARARHPGNADCNRGGRGGGCGGIARARLRAVGRSEENTSELQSLMRSTYAVFCLQKKNNNNVVKQSQVDTDTVSDID